ncbi:MAG: hypothetical protein ACK4GL_08760 [Flavobacteriales bacterium]
MKPELKQIGRFLLILTCAGLLSFLVQIYAFSFPIAENLLVESYLFNILFATTSVFALLRINRKNPGATGFAFMGFSALKFLFFFLVFYPVYYEDGAVSRIEFFSFFIPYSLCLIAEIVFLSKILNK